MIHVTSMYEDDGSITISRVADFLALARARGVRDDTEVHIFSNPRGGISLSVQQEES